MTKVVDIAVKEVKDGTPFRAGLELEDDLPQYEVSLMVGRQCVEEEIDAVSGKVLSVEKQKLETTAGYR